MGLVGTVSVSLIWRLCSLMSGIRDFCSLSMYLPFCSKFYIRLRGYLVSDMRCAYSGLVFMACICSVQVGLAVRPIWRMLWAISTNKLAETTAFAYIRFWFFDSRCLAIGNGNVERWTNVSDFKVTYFYDCFNMYMEAVHFLCWIYLVFCYS